MAATAYVVTAPCAIVRVRDAAGAWTMVTFYKDATIPADRIDAGSLKHHLDGDMLAEVAASAPEPEPQEPVTPPPADAPPSKNAPKDDWVLYAVTRRAEGVSEEDALAAAEFKTKADLIAEFGS